MLIEQLKRLSGEEAASIAELHREALPGSLVSRLGQRYAESFYRYVARSGREALFVARAKDDGPIVGACALSLDPATFDRRLLIGSLLLLALAMRPHVVVQTYFSRAANEEREFGGEAPEAFAKLPEVVTIFARVADRSRGIGAALLDEVERLLRGRGQPAYQVKTLDEEGNRAVKFYLDHGFAECARYRKYGRRFRVFVKNVAPAGRAESTAAS